MPSYRRKETIVTAERYIGDPLPGMSLITLPTDGMTVWTVRTGPGSAAYVKQGQWIVQEQGSVFFSVVDDRDFQNYFEPVAEVLGTKSDEQRRKNLTAAILSIIENAQRFSITPAQRKAVRELVNSELAGPSRINVPSV